YMPPDWHHTPGAALDRLPPAPGKLGAGEPRRLVPRRRGSVHGSLRKLRSLARRRGLATVETNLLLRAVAITLVVGTHIGLFHFQGGAHLLLIIAGWTFARFSLSHNEPSRAILRSAARIAIPAMLFLAWRVAVTPDVSVSN